MSGPAEPPVLEARNVARSFRRRRVLRDATLSLRPGELVGIGGQNGSGKTTLVQILAGVLAPTSGEVRRQRGLGYAPQTPLLYGHLTPWEHFRYVAAARGIPSSVWTVRAMELAHRYRFEDWLDDRTTSLSGGTRQKVNLALAFLSDAALFLLDEPYGGFEWEAYLCFWAHVDELRAAGRTLLVVSHLFHDRTRFDRLLELRDGVLVPVPCAA